MRSFLNRRPSPAMVVSLIALFCSLGGVSYGVATGSIDSREIKNNTVRSKDIRNNTVRSRDVRNRSLLARDFKPGQLPAGPRGATGAQGAPGVSGLERVIAESDTDSISPKVVGAECPAGKRAIGSGGLISGGTRPDGQTDVVMTAIVPSGVGLPVRVSVQAREEEPTSDNWDVSAIAICANVE